MNKIDSIVETIKDKISLRLQQEENYVPKRSCSRDDDHSSGLRNGLRIALQIINNIDKSHDRF